jgi:hypothetical protein
MMPKRAAPEKPKILANPTGGIVHSAYSQKYDLAWRIMPDNGLPIDNFQIVYFPVSNHICVCRFIFHLQYFSCLKFN